MSAAQDCGISPEVLVVKEEPDWDGVAECDEAAAEGLYMDHEEKPQLVLGPQQLQPQDIAYTIQPDMVTVPLELAEKIPEAEVFREPPCEGNNAMKRRHSNMRATPVQEEQGSQRPSPMMFNLSVAPPSDVLKEPEPKSQKPTVEVSRFEGCLLQYPCLWDPADASYKDIIIKQRARRELLVKFNKISSITLTDADIKRKIRAYCRYRLRNPTQNQCPTSTTTIETTTTTTDSSSDSATSSSSLAELELEIIHRIGRLSTEQKLSCFQSILTFLKLLENIHEPPPPPVFTNPTGTDQR